MNQEEIQMKVITIVSDQLNVDENKITCDSKIHDDLDADSLDKVELIMAIEEEFGIEILDMEVEEGIETVGHIVDYIERKLKELIK